MNPIFQIFRIVWISFFVEMAHPDSAKAHLDSTQAHLGLTQAHLGLAQKIKIKKVNFGSHKRPPEVSVYDRLHVEIDLERSKISSTSQTIP